MTAARDYLRKTLPSSIHGVATDLLLDVLGTAKQYNWDLAEKIEAQLYETTAEKKYLARKGSQLGISEPENVGLDSEAFRDLIIARNIGQLTKERLMSVLYAFFGRDAVQAHTVSVAAEPYIIVDLSTLDLKIDRETDCRVIFHNTDFSDPTQATALEVAASINHSLAQQEVSALALMQEDYSTGAKYVVIYTKTQGLEGCIQVMGGTAQPVLLFDTLVGTGAAAQTWAVSQNGVYARFSQTSADTGLIALLREGDYVVALDTALDSANRGGFAITSVYQSSVGNSRYFEVQNVGTTETSVLADHGLKFFRPTLHRLYDSSNSAYIRTLPNDTIEVVTPATSPAIDKTVAESAYIAQNTVLTISAASVDTDRAALTVTTSAVHGLAQDRWVFIDGLAFATGGKGGSLNGCLQVQSVTDGYTFLCTIAPGASTGDVPTLDVTNATATAVAAPDRDILSCIVYDPDAGYRIREERTTLTAVVDINAPQSILEVADATVFPDAPGYILIGLGQDFQAAPVPYFGRASDTELVLDRSFRFLVNIPVGASVNLLDGRTLVDPDSTVHPNGALYLTSSTQGRILALENISEMTSAGTKMIDRTLYPGDKYLAGAGLPTSGASRLSSIVEIYAGDDVDADVANAKEGV